MSSLAAYKGSEVKSGRLTVHDTQYNLRLRSYLKRTCSYNNTDSFIIYLNAPATSDGSMLLLDSDSDGMASDVEMYRVSDMMSDLAACRARHVHVIIDQSFSGEVVEAFRRSNKHVCVYGSSKSHQSSYLSEFTQAWTSKDNDFRCTKDTFRRSSRQTRHSTAAMSKGLHCSGVTIFGAPCRNLTTLTSRQELQKRYTGCQRVNV